MAQGNRSLLFLGFPDEQHLLAFKLVLTYEASKRNLSKAQAFLEIIQEAIDLDSYPPGLRFGIEAIREKLSADAHERSVQEALESSRSLKSA